MAEWGWTVVLVLLAVTLVQVVAYYYLVRGGGGRSMLSPSADQGGNAAPDTFGSGDAGGRDDAETDPRSSFAATPEEIRRCTQCGSPNENDPVFRYCRNCGREL